MGTIYSSSTKIVQLSVLAVMLFAMLLPDAKAAPIVDNNTEDLDIIIQQIIGTEPNVVTILDLSGSMGRNYGGEQIGDWDGEDVFDRCGGTGSENARSRTAFCAENIANLTICSSRTCTADGHRCETAEDLAAQVACVTAEGEITQEEIEDIYSEICGGSTITACNNNGERNRAAAAMEAAAGLTQCSVASNCHTDNDDDNPSCNTTGDFNRFRDCMEEDPDQFVFSFLQEANCTGGTTECFGDFEWGSSRMDVALNVIFNVLDADNSLSELECSDTQTSSMTERVLQLAAKNIWKHLTGL